MQKSGSVRGAASKRRLLALLPFRTKNRAGGGQLGWVCNVASATPVMYIQFLQGRLKLFGTVIRGQNSYLAVEYSNSLKRGAAAERSQQLAVRATLRSVVVFSEWRWVGDRASNPTEASLPLPPELSIEPCRLPHLGQGGSLPQSSGSGSQKAEQDGDDSDFGGATEFVGGEGGLDDSEDEAVSSRPAKRQRRQRATIDSDDGDEQDDAEESGGNDGAFHPPSSPPLSQSSLSSQRARRASTNAVKSYAEKSVEEEEEEPEQSEEEEAEQQQHP